MKHKNATATPLRGPRRMTTRGIINRCIGTPNGDGMDMEDAAKVTAARMAVFIRTFAYPQFLKVYTDIKLI